MHLLQWLSLAVVGLQAEALPGPKSASSLIERRDGFSHSKTSVRIQKRALRGRAAASEHLENRRQRRRKLSRRGQRLKRTNCQPNQDCIEYAPDGEQAVIPIDEQPDPTATKSEPCSKTTSAGSQDTSSPGNAPAQGPIRDLAVAQGTAISGRDADENVAGLAIWAAGRNEGGMLGMDFGYFMEVQAGTPLKRFEVQIDTASGDTWLMSDTCAGCGAHSRLGTDSSTFVRQDSSNWSLDYSSALDQNTSGGRVSGSVVTDTMMFTTDLSLTDFQFGIAEAVTDQFGDDRIPFSGILGLANSNAVPTVSLSNTISPIMKLSEASCMQYAQVGIALGRSADEENNGEISFGGVNPDLIEGDLYLMKNISPNGFWEGPVSGISVNELATTEDRSAIFDTRTALILAPVEDLVYLFSTAEGAYFDAENGMLLSCDADYRMSFTFGNTSFELDSRDLIFAPATGAAADLCQAPPCCYSAVQATKSAYGLSSQQWIFGATALKNLYLALDFVQDTIGVARMAYSSQADSDEIGEDVDDSANSEEEESSADMPTDASESPGDIGQPASATDVYSGAGEVGLVGSVEPVE